MFNRRPYGLPVDEARDNTDYDGFFRRWTRAPRGLRCGSKARRR